jgi:hypothetical protein
LSHEAHEADLVTHLHEKANDPNLSERWRAASRTGGAFMGFVLITHLGIDIYKEYFAKKPPESVDICDQRVTFGK